MVRLHKVNETFLRVDCEASILYELSEHFTFYSKGYQHSPAYKKGHWDGKIRLLNKSTRLIYTGLLSRIQEWLTERDIPWMTEGFQDKGNIPEDWVNQFSESLKLPFPPHDYQVSAVIHSIENRRALLLSPTASGKSLMVYLLSQWYREKPILIICPTVQLVKQMSSDFREYGFSGELQQIFSGQDKDTDTRIIITTWQSVYELPKEWFSRFKVVIGDEAHHFKAKSLIEIMTKLSNCPMRFACTGSLDDEQLNELVIEGLFGPKKVVTTTLELIERGKVSDINIHALKLLYPNWVRKFMGRTITETKDGKKKKRHTSYPEEMDFLTQCEARNQFLTNLAVSLPQNTLMLFQYVQKHGHCLNEMITRAAGEGRKVYYVHGGVDVDDREKIRRIMEQETNAIVIASYGTFSTGINIKNLHNLIFASPTKSPIRVLQSIGRGLRLHESKEILNLYDVSDDLSWMSWKNHTLKHFEERIGIYAREGFRYRVFDVELGVHQ